MNQKMGGEYSHPAYKATVSDMHETWRSARGLQAALFRLYHSVTKCFLWFSAEVQGLTFS